MILLITTPIVLVSAILLLRLENPPIKSIALVLTILGLTLVFSSCVTKDPSMWQPYSHANMAKSCRVVCHPNGVLRYDSISATCECQRKGD